MLKSVWPSVSIKGEEKLKKKKKQVRPNTKCVFHLACFGEMTIYFVRSETVFENKVIIYFSSHGSPIETPLMRAITAHRADHTPDCSWCFAGLSLESETMHGYFMTVNNITWGPIRWAMLVSHTISILDSRCRNFHDETEYLKEWREVSCVLPLWTKTSSYYRT